MCGSYLTWKRTKICPVTKMRMPCEADGWASNDEMRCWTCWKGSDVSFATIAVGPCTFCPCAHHSTTFMRSLQMWLQTVVEFSLCMGKNSVHKQLAGISVVNAINAPGCEQSCHYFGIDVICIHTKFWTGASCLFRAGKMSISDGSINPVIYSNESGRFGGKHTSNVRSAWSW